jgi:hypothetical protein
MSVELDWLLTGVAIENEFPGGVVVRELVREDRRPTKEFIYCDDMPMLKGAFGLPGSVGLVWLLASHRSRLRKSAWVTLPQSMLSEWGIGRSAKSRALAALREAGYIDVIQSGGGSSRIRVHKARVPDLKHVPPA